MLQYRIRTEYGAESRLVQAPWRIVRWIDAAGDAVREEDLPSSAGLALDAGGRPVVLFTAEWELSYYLEKHPKALLRRLPSELSGRT